jgi:hypothetical protein
MRNRLKTWDRFCEQSFRDGSDLRDPPAVVVLVGAGAHLRVVLVRDERDVVVREPDGRKIVLGAAGELLQAVGVLGVRALLQVRRVEVIVVVAVELHGEDHLLRVERQIHALHIGLGEAVAVDEIANVTGPQISHLDARAGDVAAVVHDLAHAVGDIDADALAVDHGVLPDRIDDLVEAARVVELRFVGTARRAPGHESRGKQSKEQWAHQRTRVEWARHGSSGFSRSREHLSRTRANL